jgi:hypothetical protein
MAQVTLGIGVLGLLALLPTATSAAEEPAWWEVCEELPGDQIEHCFYEHNGEAEPSGPPVDKPVDPIRRHIHHRFKGIRSPFVNCPPANRIPIEGGGKARVCEFRVVVRGSVVRGTASVAPESRSGKSSRWHLLGFHAEARAPRHWRRCSPPDWTSSVPVRLSVRGVLCPEARHIAGNIASRALTSGNLRIPHRFDEGEYRTNTLGFVAGLFHCRGSVHVRQPGRGGENPYGHETAACRTKFGDRLTYVFDQGS